MVEYVTAAAAAIAAAAALWNTHQFAKLSGRHGANCRARERMQQMQGERP